MGPLVRYVATFVTGATLIVAIGCGKDKSTSPQGYASVSGYWSGSGDDSSGPGDLSMTLSQNKQSVSGTFSAEDWSSGTVVGGTVTGNVTGSQFSGSFTGTYSGCQFTMNFSATVSDSVMVGTYNGTNSCSGPVTDGSFTLRQ